MAKPVYPTDGLGKCGGTSEPLSVWLLPSLWRSLATTPLNFDFCVGLEIAKTPEPLIAAQKCDQFWKRLYLGYLNLKRR